MPNAIFDLGLDKLRAYAHCAIFVCVGIFSLPPPRDSAGECGIRACIRARTRKTNKTNNAT
eukprot:2620916-Heterocapsa_arctica.AAC.1